MNRLSISEISSSGVESHGPECESENRSTVNLMSGMMFGAEEITGKERSGVIYMRNHDNRGNRVSTLLVQ